MKPLALCALFTGLLHAGPYWFTGAGGGTFPTNDTNNFERTLPAFGPVAHSNSYNSGDFAASTAAYADLASGVLKSGETLDILGPADGLAAMSRSPRSAILSALATAVLCLTGRCWATSRSRFTWTSRDD